MAGFRELADCAGSLMRMAQACRRSLGSSEMGDARWEMAALRKRERNGESKAKEASCG